MILGGFPEQLWRSRTKRAAFLILVLFASATIVPPPPPRPLPGAVVARLRFTPVALDPGDPARRRVGDLLYLGGWVVEADTPRFGSISGLHVEGGTVTAISDFGTLFRFALPGANGGTAPVEISALLPGPSSPHYKWNRDTEAMWIEGPWLWVAFERHNMVWRYRRTDLAAVAAARPAPMRGWRRNAGPEAMARLADGRFLVLAEGASDGKVESAAALFDGDPADPRTRAAALRYRRVPGFRVTEAAMLPDGRLLVLNRRFHWSGGLAAVLTVADVRGLRPGATIEGRELARLEPPLNVDNMEALSVTVENGRTIVWIASDDNLFPLQRTLLLKFALVE